MIVYCLHINGKKYIGITKNCNPLKRISDHKLGDQPVGRAIRKHGIDSWEILHRGKSWPELCSKEIELIAEHKTKVPNGYNLTDGGEGHLGFKHSEETKKKMSLQRMGNQNQPAGWKPKPGTLAKMKASNARPEVREAARKGLKEKWKDPVWSAKMREVLKKNNERKRNAKKGG